MRDKERIDFQKVVENLKASESRLKGILSSMVDLVFALDEQANFIFYHAQQKEDLLMPPEKFIGKKHSEVLPKHLNDLFVDAFKKNKKGEIVEFEYWLEIDNMKKWFIVKLTPLFIDQKFSGSVAVVRDITERKQTQEELKKYREHLEELVKKRTAKLKSTNKQLQLEIKKRKSVEQALKKSESELRNQKVVLEQKNIALGEIIAQIEIEKRRIRDDILMNTNLILAPILDRLKAEKSAQKYVGLLQHHIDALASSYGTKINEKGFWLTPKEIEICNLIKAGLKNKDISDFLHISCQTVEGHRKKIRRKLGIANRSINLTSFLRDL